MDKQQREAMRKIGPNKWFLAIMQTYTQQKEESQYEKQANEFCAKYGLLITAKLSRDQFRPGWCEKGHGNYGWMYDITISNGKTEADFEFWSCAKYRLDYEAFLEGLRLFGATYRLDNAAIHQPTRKDVATDFAPTAYDVLASVGYDYTACEMSFEDWADDLGYDNDSLQAEKTYKACCDLSRKLRKVIPLKAMAELQEIS